MQRILDGKPAARERTGGRTTLSSNPTKRSALVTYASQVQGGPNVLSQVVQHFLMPALESQLRRLDAGHSRRLSSDAGSARSIVQPNRETFNAEYVKHHVDPFQSELPTLGQLS